MPHCLSRDPAGLCNAVRRLVRTASGIRLLDKSMQAAKTFTRSVIESSRGRRRSAIIQVLQLHLCALPDFAAAGRDPTPTEFQVGDPSDWHAGGCRSRFHNSLKVLASSGVRHPPSKACQAAEAVSMWIRISSQLSVQLKPSASFASDPDGARLGQIPSWLSISSLNL